MDLPKPIKDFIKIFSKLPGMGPRQTTRLAFLVITSKKKNPKIIFVTLLLTCFLKHKYVQIVFL